MTALHSRHSKIGIGKRFEGTKGRVVKCILCPRERYGEVCFVDIGQGRFIGPLCHDCLPGVYETEKRKRIAQIMEKCWESNR